MREGPSLRPVVRGKSYAASSELPSLLRHPDVWFNQSKQLVF
jgi:hypothetical protein